VRASRTIAHPPERVFAFLSDLRNHWRLENAFIAVNHVGPKGGTILIRGPLGISRSARTQVIEALPPSRLRGQAEIGRATVGIVSWQLEPSGQGTHVVLSAQVMRASLRDRLVLALGGRVWLSRRFAHVLERLEQTLAF
jgi:uncharacterized protein YndB with AHSA1/START domain